MSIKTNIKGHRSAYGIHGVLFVDFEMLHRVFETPIWKQDYLINPFSKHTLRDKSRILSSKPILIRSPFRSMI